MNVLLPVIVAGGATALNDLMVKGGVRPTVLIGTFIFGSAIFLLAELNTEIALSIAWVTAITSVLLNGVPVFQAISKGVN